MLIHIHRNSNSPLGTLSRLPLAYSYLASHKYSLSNISEVCLVCPMSIDHWCAVHDTESACAPQIHYSSYPCRYVTSVIITYNHMLGVRFSEGSLQTCFAESNILFAWSSVNIGVHLFSSFRFVMLYSITA